jgi:hypothetical protein
MSPLFRICILTCTEAYIHLQCLYKACVEDDVSNYDPSGSPMDTAWNQAHPPVQSGASLAPTGFTVTAPVAAKETLHAVTTKSIVDEFTKAAFKLQMKSKFRVSSNVFLKKNAFLFFCLSVSS